MTQNEGGVHDMSTVSWTIDTLSVPSAKCSFCGEPAKHGGFHRGFPDLVLCNQCLTSGHGSMANESVDHLFHEGRGEQ